MALYSGNKVKYKICQRGLISQKIESGRKPTASVLAWALLVDETSSRGVEQKGVRS